MVAHGPQPGSQNNRKVENIIPGIDRQRQPNDGGQELGTNEIPSATRHSEREELKATSTDIALCEIIG